MFLTPRSLAVGFLHAGVLQKLVLVIASLETQEPLERWTFDIQQEWGEEGSSRYGPNRDAPGRGGGGEGETWIEVN